jgi:ABC-type glutathione transport system ATPase component
MAAYQQTFLGKVQGGQNQKNDNVSHVTGEKNNKNKVYTSINKLKANFKRRQNFNQTRKPEKKEIDDIGLAISTSSILPIPNPLY